MAAQLPLLLQLLPLIPPNSTDSQVVGSFRLEKGFFEQAAGEVHDIINYELHGAEIKDQCFSVGIGKMCIKRLTVIRVESPKLEFTINEKGFRWRARGWEDGPAGGAVRLEGALNFSSRIFRKTAKVRLIVSDIKSDIRAKVVNSGGRPKIDLIGSKVKIGDFRIARIDAGFTGVILSIFSQLLELFLEYYLPGKAWFIWICAICEIVTLIIGDAIKTYVNKTNKWIVALPDDIPVWGNVTVRYKLTKDPIFRDGAVEVTSLLNFSSNDIVDDDDYDIEDEFPELDLGNNLSPFSNPFENIPIADIPLIMIACIGAILLILDRKYVFITVLCCILLASILLLLLPSII